MLHKKLQRVGEGTTTTTGCKDLKNRVRADRWRTTQIPFQIRPFPSLKPTKIISFGIELTVDVALHTRFSLYALRFMNGLVVQCCVENDSFLSKSYTWHSKKHTETLPAQPK